MQAMSTTRITSRDLADMTRHWLGTPPNGYLGLDYGSDAKAMLHSPMAAGLAEGFIAKARVDVPLLQGLGAGAINLYSYDLAMDHKAIVFEVGDQLVQFDDSAQPFPNQGGDAELANPVDPLIASGLTEGGANKLHTQVHIVLPSEGFF